MRSHEYDLKTSCSKAYKAFTRLYFAMSSLWQTKSMKPRSFWKKTNLPSSSILMPTSFPTPLSPKDLKTDFSKVQSSAVSLETFRQTTMRDGDLLWTEKYVLIVKVLKEVFNDQLIRSVERILWSMSSVSLKVRKQNGWSGYHAEKSLRKVITLLRKGQSTMSHCFEKNLQNRS